MPYAPKRPCTYPGCPALTDTGRCELHTVQDRKQYDVHKRNKQAKRFYNSDLWQKARTAKLSHSPLCEACKAQGTIVGADLVHHIDGNVHNLSEENLMSLCAGCHSRIEAQQRGGFVPKQAWGGCER
jgi:5-methylcytosine-specific restriction enzyme A